MNIYKANYIEAKQQPVFNKKKAIFEIDFLFTMYTKIKIL